MHSQAAQLSGLQVKLALKCELQVLCLHQTKLNILILKDVSSALGTFMSQELF